MNVRKSSKGGIQKCLLQGVSCFDLQLLKKHTLNPKTTLLSQFHAQKALLKVPKICNKNFWIENDPPLQFGTFFRKYIRFGSWTLPLVLALRLRLMVEVGVDVDSDVEQEEK